MSPVSTETTQVIYTTRAIINFRIKTHQSSVGILKVTVMTDKQGN